MMKKTTIKISLVALTLLWSGATLNAQFQVADVSETIVSGYSSRTQDLSKLPKMDKDIVILENVLGDLFDDRDRLAWTSRGGKGMYIESSGVIFNLGVGSIRPFAVGFLRDGKKENSEEEEEVSFTKYNNEYEENIRQKSKEFLANYGSLLSELKSGEKIMLNIDYSLKKESEKTEKQGNAYTIFDSRSQKQRMQSSISYSTINQLNNGKITLEEAMNEVESKVIEDVESEMNDAKILAGILDDLLQSSLDGKFRRRGKTSWSYFDGFGLMYNINMSSRVGNAVYISQGQRVSSGRISLVGAKEDEKELDPEELAKEMDEAYPKFEKMLKENIVQYGRTLRSLKKGESVIVNVDFGTLVQNSKLPRSIRMVVPKSSIDAYARGQKTLDQVVSEIDVTQLQSSIQISGGVVYEASNFPTVIETVPQPVVPGVPVIKGRARSNN